MTFKLEINCDNAAFGESSQDAAFEVANLLRHTAQRLQDGHTEGRLTDFNGNSVGGFTFKGKRKE